MVDTPQGPTGTRAIGYTQIPATITNIVNGIYYATDKMGKFRDNLYWVSTSGPKPQIGEIWMLELEAVGWTLSYPLIANARVITAASDITALNGQTILANATAGGFTVTLAPDIDASIVVKVTSVNANVVKVVSLNGEDVEGTTSYVLTARQSGTFTFNTDWWMTHFIQAAVLQSQASAIAHTSMTGVAT